jgi:hypothetical protein
MSDNNKPHRGLRAYRLFLAFLGLNVLGLNIRWIVWNEKARNIVSPYDTDPNPYKNYNFAADYSQLLVPDLGLLLMFLILAVGHPRLNNQKLHSICRVLFSLALAFGLVYYPARRIDAYVQSVKLSREFAAEHGMTGDYPLTFGKEYFCSIEYGYDGDTLWLCRTLASRDMLSLIGGLLVVLELVFAGVVGEIGLH